MSIEYNENGLIIQNLAEILAERENNLKSFLGDDFIISGESVVANLQLADADRELSIQELLLYIASQLDPDQAEGIWLDYICALNNITRYRATKSTIPVIVSGSVNTSKNIGELIIVNESTDEYYTNIEPIVIEEDGTDSVMFQATSFGPITNLISDNFYLKTPSLGITGVAYDTSRTGVVGRNTETDAELRLRRANSVTYTASSILSSIKSAVASLSNIQGLQVYENDTMQTKEGLPPKSFEIVVQGGDDDEIAQAILSKKPVGIQAFGNTVVEVTDEDLNIFEVGFTRPTEVPISLTITFTSGQTQSQDWKDSLKTELVEEFKKIYTVGESVYAYNLYYVLNKHPEIINVTNLKVSKTSSISWSDTVAIQKRELAQLVADNITITQG